MNGTSLIQRNPRRVNSGSSGSGSASCVAAGGSLTGEHGVGLEKIAEMPQPDRGMAERIHAIVSKAAPELWPKTWYGMPAYSREGKTVVCFFQGADKFEARYATFGFNDAANLDEGVMWPVSFALIELGDAQEALISELVRKAVS